MNKKRNIVFIIIMKSTVEHNYRFKNFKLQIAWDDIKNVQEILKKSYLLGSGTILYHNHNIYYARKDYFSGGYILQSKEEKRLSYVNAMGLQDR